MTQTKSIIKVVAIILMSIPLLCETSTLTTGGIYVLHEGQARVTVFNSETLEQFELRLVGRFPYFRDKNSRFLPVELLSHFVNFSVRGIL